MSETPPSEPSATEQTSPPPEKQPGPPISLTKKGINLATGFIGWFLINGLVWGLFTRFLGIDIYRNPSFNALCGLPLNIFALIVFAVIRETRWIALGILAAWALNLLLSIIFGIILNGACLVPFFLDIGLK